MLPKQCGQYEKLNVTMVLIVYVKQVPGTRKTESNYMKEQNYIKT